MTTHTKLTLSDAIKKEKGKKQEIALFQKLCNGTYEAEGRYLHEDMTEAEEANSPFETIPREAWLSFDADFEASQLSACFFLDTYGGATRQEKYVNINVFHPITQNLNKGGRPKLLDQAQLNAEIAAYFMCAGSVIDPYGTKEEPYFLEHIKGLVPCLYKLINGEELGADHEEIREHIEVPNDGEEAVLGEIPSEEENEADRNKTLRRALIEFLKHYRAAYRKIDDFETKNS